jgi:hypothetical protein
VKSTLIRDACSLVENLREIFRAKARYDWVEPTDVIARLDRAIQYTRSVFTGSPVKPGDDSEVCVNLSEKRSSLVRSRRS